MAGMIRRESIGARRRVIAYSELHEQVTELREQRAAISEILRTIASSPLDMQPVFDAILANAIHLCRAKFGSIGLIEEHGFRVVARRGTPKPYAELFPQGPVHPILPGSRMQQLVNNKLPIHRADMATEQAYLERNPFFVAAVELAGIRTELWVPMLKEHELIGYLCIFRARVQPFMDRQIDLVTDFVAQATIALENTRRERQRRKLQEELAHANRAATMGQLTASIAHELKQPLTALKLGGTASLRRLAMQSPDLEKIKRSVQRIINDATRANNIIDHVRDLAKKTAPQKQAFDLNEAILEVTTLTHGEAVKIGVTLQMELEPRLPRIQGDRVQLQQVMLNLIVNAIQAMGGIGDGTRELEISTEVVESEGVRVGVRDSGPGLSPESLPSLFEPFYTTKPDGMGMGLSICRSIIEAHGGRLWATGCKPSGALFQFTVPVERIDRDRIYSSQ